MLGRCLVLDPGYSSGEAFAAILARVWQKGLGDRKSLQQQPTECTIKYGVTLYLYIEYLKTVGLRLRCLSIALGDFDFMI